MILNVKFGAQTDEFASGVRNAIRPVEDFSARIKDLNDQLRAVDAPVKTVAASSKEAANSTDKLSFATAGATREFIVLGHEVMTGNFSRIPGSMMVLAERTGGLQSIIQSITPAAIGWTAAIVAAVAATYEWVAADEKLSESQNTIRGAMELNNQSQSYNADATEQNIIKLRILGDLSADTAEKISVSFARAGNLSVDLKEKLILMVGDYAAATGKDAPKAAEDLIKMFENPKHGAEQLAATFKGVLSPAQLEQIELAAKNGQSLKAQGELYDGLASKIEGFRDKQLTPFKRDIEEVTNAWVKFAYAISHEGQTYDFTKPSLAKPTPIPEGQKAAAEEQERQNKLNDSITAGYDIERQSGLLVARKNALLERQHQLIEAANAAESQGNSATAARFRGDAAEVGQQIGNLKPKGQAKEDSRAKAAQREKEQLAREEVTYEEQMGRLRLDNEKTILDEKVAMGEISNNEKFAQLQKLALEEYNIENEALVKESKLSGLSLIDKQKIDDQMLLLHRKYLNQKDALTRQSALAEQKQFHDIFQGIDRAFTQSINGILQGTQTWRQAMANIFTGILSVFVDMAEKMVSKWIESMLMQAIYGKTEGADQIATSAAEAGAAAYASTAAIPIVGPALAPAAAATAYGDTMAFTAGLASYAVGSWELPSDQIAQVHKGEMIIPKPFADSMRENGGMGGGETHTHIHATDAQSFVNMLEDNKAVITGIMKDGTRNFSSNLRPST